MHAYFMRHGQTNYNLLGLCNDDPTRDVHLTEEGIRQAEAAAARLTEVPFERILVSELPRTRQTAEVVNRGHGAPIEMHPGINDLRSGLDGEPVAELKRRLAADPLHTRVNDGETLAEHRDRVVAFLRWLAVQPWSTVLVVAHEETLRVIEGHFRGLDDATMVGLAFHNAEVLHFEL